MAQRFESWGDVRGFLSKDYPRISQARIAREMGDSRQQFSWRLNDDDHSAPTVEFEEQLLAALERIVEADAGVGV